LPTFALLSFALLACGGELPREATAPGTREPSAKSMRTPRQPPLRVAVVSDLNGSYGSRSYGDAVHAAVDRLIELQPDLVLSTGDMVAGQRGGLDYAGMWAAFHRAVSDPLAQAGIPFAVSPGNHDASGYPTFAHERATYVEEWLPRRPALEFQDATHYPLRYSFVRGPALFVALDSTTLGPLDAEQMRWLDDELTRGAHHPVKIVFGHVPLYPFAEGRRRDFIGDRSLEELLQRHRVTLFLSGHHHAYYPGRRGDLQLVSMACLGGGARPLIGTSDPSPRSLVVFEVNEGGVHQLDALTGPALDVPILRTALPAFVGLPGMRIERDDLVFGLR
jgi:hypothetical protein